ncbi:MAG: DUF4488 domain-containing protein [Bacteroidaceae bacterium]|nr:DUF4488 domain-containing protein [Bacteroidaceae bacterium]
MKRLMLLALFAFMAGALYVSAQQKVDKDIYGLWQYAEERVAPDGSVQYIGKPIFKSINQDNTYFAMVSITLDVAGSEKEKPYSITETYITQSGEIEFSSPGSYMEYIGEHYTNPGLTNTITSMKYEFKDDAKNVMYIEYLTANNNDTWFGETWIKVQPFGTKK